MSRKDYEVIAEAVKNSSSINALAVTLCTVFRADNPKFNSTKFLNACGIETER